MRSAQEAVGMVPAQLENHPITLQALQIGIELALFSVIGGDDGRAPLQQQTAGGLPGAGKPNDDHPLPGQIRHGSRFAVGGSEFGFAVPGSGFRVPG
jgi:hypothetical protein